MSVGETGAAAVFIAEVDDWSGEQLGKPLKGSEGLRVRDDRFDEDHGKFCLAQKFGGLFKDPRIRLGRRRWGKPGRVGKRDWPVEPPFLQLGVEAEVDGPLRLSHSDAIGSSKGFRDSGYTGRLIVPLDVIPDK